jgi:hypothetical protein
MASTVIPMKTLPTKVPSDSLGRIGSLKRTSDKSLFPMALGCCGHRITHQLRPINMNGRSILSVTSMKEPIDRLNLPQATRLQHVVRRVSPVALRVARKQTDAYFGQV